MTTVTTDPTYAPRLSWLARAESWMDARGKGAWIAAMVLGFIFFWPLGLALLAYMTWSKRMFSSKSCSRKSSRAMMSRNTGNSAFDAYKADTLSRLEQEQSDFEAFLARLRAAKDKAEFDEFMDERSRHAGAATSDDDTADRPAGQA